MKGFGHPKYDSTLSGTLVRHCKSYYSEQQYHKTTAAKLLVAEADEGGTNVEATTNYWSPLSPAALAPQGFKPTQGPGAISNAGVFLI